MSTQYRLPCGCGKNLTVSPSQAGLSLKCGCGKTLTVPTIGKLRALEAIDATEIEVPLERSTWGAAQQLMVLGIFVALLGATFAGYNRLTRPEAPGVSSEALKKKLNEIDNMTISATYNKFHEFHRPIENLGMAPDLIEYLEAANFYRTKLYAGLGVTAVGAVLAVIGLCVSSFAPSK